jgi:hypothetical protein
MKRKTDWLRAVVILAAGILTIVAMIALGKSPLAWMFPLAHAGTANVTWVAPTKNCDGTTLTNLAGYRLRWGVGTAELPLTATSYNIFGLPPGTWWVSIAAYNTTGQESQFVSATKVVTAQEFVTTGTDVFSFLKQANGILLVKVGTVPKGVQCSSALTVNGKYVVPTSSVAWSGSARPIVVVGDCG